MQSPETRSPSPSSYHTDPLLVVSSYLYQRRSIICYRRATCFVSNWIAVAAGFAQVGAKYPHVEHCEDESRGTCKCLFKATRRACLELSRYSQAHIPDILFSSSRDQVFATTLITRPKSANGHPNCHDVPIPRPTLAQHHPYEHSNQALQSAAITTTARALWCILSVFSTTNSTVP